MRLFKEMFVIFLGAVALLYLIYPSWGVFELIPDALPFVGSIDEGTASLILISVLRYYGLDLTRMFGGRAAGQHPLVPTQRESGYVNPSGQTSDAQYQSYQQEQSRRNQGG